MARGAAHVFGQGHSGLVTSPTDQLLRLVGSSFRSVWALELLLLLKTERRPWAPAELIAALRASELVVNKALEELIAGGLVSVDVESARYLPANNSIARDIEKIERLYAARPDAVRRAIVSATASGATAFADAFRLRKD
jgi:hypothetical protein